MICIKTQHFKVNRILLMAIGLWPYQKSKFVQLQISLFFSILISFVIFQVTTLITTKCTFDFILKIFSIIIVFSFYVIKYNMFWINTHRVRNLLEQLQYICNDLKDENETAIIIKYGNDAKRCTVILTSFTISVTLIPLILISPIWPQILGTVLHINKSQPQSHIIRDTTEYFIDEKKYFYLIILHANAVICIGSTTILATGTLLLGCIIHICGIFKIASYRMEQAMTTKMLENITMKSQAIIYQKIFYAVEIHRKAMKFSDLLVSSFKGSFALIALVCVLSLTLNILAIFRNILLGNKETCIVHLMIVSSMIAYMFLTNYAGQEVTNYSNQFYITVYNVQWYMAPLPAQKMILFILQRGERTFNLNIARLFVASLECFGMLIKASMSYVTALYSMQQ